MPRDLDTEATRHPQTIIYHYCFWFFCWCGPKFHNFFTDPSFWLVSFNITGDRNFETNYWNHSSVSTHPRQRNILSRIASHPVPEEFLQTLTLFKVLSKRFFIIILKQMYFRRLKDKFVKPLQTSMGHLLMYHGYLLKNKETLSKDK